MAAMVIMLLCVGPGMVLAQQDVRQRIEGECESVRVSATAPLIVPEDAIPAATLVEQLAAGEPIDLQGVTINGNLDLSALVSEGASGITGTLRAPISIVSSTLNGNLIIPSGLRVVSPISFAGTTIAGNVSISEATFSSGVDFDGAYFQSAVTLNQTVFLGTFSMVGAEADSLLNVLGVRFREPANFSDAQFRSQVSFLTNTIFERDTAFDRTRFSSERLRFTDVTFERDMSFFDADLCGSTRFERAAISGGVNFTGALFGNDLRLQDGSSFGDDVLLTDTAFNGDLRVRSGATFEGDLVLSGINFTAGRGLSIQEGTFNGDVNGVNVDFRDTDRLELIESTFNGEVDFTDAQFSLVGPFTVHESIFSGDLSLNRARFNSIVSITRSDVSGITDLRGAYFANDVLIGESTFNDELLFRGAIFDSRDVAFTDSDFNSIDLSTVTFQPDSLNLVDATYNELVAFDFNLAALAVPDTALNRFEVFSALERSFLNQGSRELINETTYQARSAECALNARTPDISYLVNCPMSQYFLGYRVRLFPPIRTAVVTVLIFGVLYWFGGLKAIPDPDDPTSRKGETIWDALGLSFDLFFAIRWNQIHVDFDNMRLAWLWRGLVLIEWVFGLYILVGLASALANTVPLFSTVLEQLR